MGIEENLPPVEMEILLPENLKNKEKPPPTDKKEDDNGYYHHNKENLPPSKDENEENNPYCCYTLTMNLENMPPPYERTLGEVPRNQHQQTDTQNEETLTSPFDVMDLQKQPTST